MKTSHVSVSILEAIGDYRQHVGHVKIEESMVVVFPFVFHFKIYTKLYTQKRVARFFAWDILANKNSVFYSAYFIRNEKIFLLCEIT